MIRHQGPIGPCRRGLGASLTLAVVACSPAPAHLTAPGGPTTGSAAPVASPAPKVDGPTDPAPTPYVLCVPLTSSPPSSGLPEAWHRFQEGERHHEAGRFREAAREFMRAARGFLAAGPATSRYNRRVAYANAVNSLLSLNLVEEARAQLANAAAIDADLADALRAMTVRLPRPAPCVATQP